MCYYFFFSVFSRKKKKSVHTIKRMYFGRLNQLFRFTLKDGICVDSKPGKLTRCQKRTFKYSNSVYLWRTEGILYIMFKKKKKIGII
jgi:hypothetical protein